MKENVNTNAIRLDQEIIADLLPVVRKELNEDIDKLIYFFNLGELNKIKKMTHKIIGTAGCYSMDNIVEECLKVERMLTGKEEELMQSIEKLRKNITSI